MAEFRRSIIEAGGGGSSRAALFALPGGEGDRRIVALLADPASGSLGLTSAEIGAA